MKTSTKLDHRPSFQFYPDDWLSEVSLRACSLEARGAWIDILCFMWAQNPRGRIKSKTAISALFPKSKTAEVMVLGEANPNQKIIDELIENGVCETTIESGEIFLINRKMYREWQISHIRSQAGSMGGRPSKEKQSESKNEAKTAPSTSTSSPSSSSVPTSTSKSGDSLVPAGAGTGLSKRSDIDVIIPIVLNEWNETAEALGLAKISKMTESRKQKLRIRLKEGFDMKALAEKIKESGFLRGDNNNGWRVDFDWLVGNDKNYLKVMEGKYQGKRLDKSHAIAGQIQATLNKIDERGLNHGK